MSGPNQPASTPPDPFDTAGKWLAANYQLTNRERDLVKIATLRGQPVSEPRLQEAVRGLALEILANRLRMLGTRLQYYVYGAVSGIAGIAALVFNLSPSGQHSHTGFLWIVLAIAVINVIWCFLWLPRRFRRKVEKALRVNGSEG